MDIETEQVKTLLMRTLKNLGVDEDRDCERFWRILKAQYSSSGYRVYHDLRHVEEVAMFLDERYPFDETKDLIIFAGFLHDFYNTKDPLAEELSATAAAMMYLEVADADQLLSDDQAIRNANFIHGAIMATKTHVTEVPGYQYLVDADLQRFLATDNTYADQIREEYKEHTDEKFNAGRPVVLERFKSREPFFYHGTEVENEAAYANIQRQLDEIGDM